MVLTLVGGAMVDGLAYDIWNGCLDLTPSRSELHDGSEAEAGRMPPTSFGFILLALNQRLQ